MNRPFRFQKCCQDFIGSHDETLSIVAMRVNDPDCSTLRSRADTPTQAPTGFMEIVCDDFPVLPGVRFLPLLRSTQHLKLRTHLLERTPALSPGTQVQTPRASKTFQPQRCGLLQSLVIACDFFEFDQRGQVFIRPHNETLSVVAVCVCNEGCSVWILPQLVAPERI